MFRSPPCVILFLAVVYPAMATDSFQFVDRTSVAGLTAYLPPVGMASGAAVADFDNDGDPDIFVPTAQGSPDRLYRNDAGTFVEIAAAAGVDGMDRARGALWMDFDGDDLLDLFVMGDCFATPGFPAPPGVTCPAPPIRLYRQISPGLFSEQATAAGLSGAFLSDPTSHLGGLVAGDVDNDGHLDLFIAIWGSERWLFLNNGDGTFTDASLASGVLDTVYQGWAPTIFDFDGDGWREILQATDNNPNQLWLNRRGGHFAEVANQTGVDTSFHEMGVSVSDVDNDGDFDVFMTNIDLGGPIQTEHNVLFRNDSPSRSAAFTDIGVSSGAGFTGWGWGTSFLDADRDGFVDLAATNGFGLGIPDDPSVFLSNDGLSPLSFSDVSTAVLFDDTDWGSGLYALDYDSDGDQDLLQILNVAGIARLYENQQTGAALSHHYLVVKPRMAGPNSHAIGSIVRVSAGGQEMARFISAGTSVLGQEPAEAFFGLGAATTADVTVEFPDGSETRLLGVAVDQMLTVAAVVEAVISPPSVAATTTGPAAWTITYSGADSVTLSDPDIQIDATGTVVASFSVSGSGTSTRTVSASGISGVGNLSFRVAAGSASSGGVTVSAFGPASAVLVGDQTDADGDFSPDLGDNCSAVFNPFQLDTDGSGLGDVCNSAQDVDGDEFEVGFDNCAAIANPAQKDFDLDGVGDSCDNCPLVPNPGQADSSGNGLGDACDGHASVVPGVNGYLLGFALLIAGALAIRLHIRRISAH